MNGANHTQSNQSLQDPNREKRRNDYPLTQLPRHAAQQHTRFHKRQDSTTTASEKIRHMPYQNPILLVGGTVACRRPGALVNKLESAWLEGVWLGRDSKTDGHLNETSDGMVRSPAQRRRWDTTLLNAVVWDLRRLTPVTRERPLKVRRDFEPILMGLVPKVRLNSARGSGHQQRQQHQAKR